MQTNLRVSLMDRLLRSSSRRRIRARGDSGDVELDALPSRADAGPYKACPKMAGFTWILTRAPSLIVALERK